MRNWHSKSLGYGESVYQSLNWLEQLRYELCPKAQSPFTLTLNTFSSETVVFFEPEFGDLAWAFGASPCERPIVDGVCWFDLAYTPAQLDDSCGEIHALKARGYPGDQFADGRGRAVTDQ
ncbi:hypothetical protein [Pseudomonas huanghezhanensis]|uniref:hypothetical protein n=1 Tax=Pseudomonas huanghezhanensis TaxID=3002903 RepID=UPI0022858811|nr:hypothetical protein [Pseudomonas sp. BSw22131]